MKDNKVLLGFLGGVAAGALLAFYMHLIKEAKPEAKSSKRTNMLMMRI
jgi:MFS superfamily sulfate permease-like transporter